MPDLDISSAAAAGRPALLPQQIGLHEIRNAYLRKGFDLWSSKKGPHRLAARSDVSPREMADFLRNIVLVRVLDQGREFQFRIVGDAIVVVQGESFQGMTTAEIDQAMPGYGKVLRRAYRRVCAAGEPIAFRGCTGNTLTNKTFLHESLLLPLGADRQTVDHILVIGVYAYGWDGMPA
jgi:hypothetical protein